MFIILHTNTHIRDFRVFLLLCRNESKQAAHMTHKLHIIHRADLERPCGSIKGSRTHTGACAHAATHTFLSASEVHARTAESCVAEQRVVSCGDDKWERPLMCSHRVLTDFHSCIFLIFPTHREIYFCGTALRHFLVFSFCIFLSICFVSQLAALRFQYILSLEVSPSRYEQDNEIHIH